MSLRRLGVRERLPRAAVRQAVPRLRGRPLPRAQGLQPRLQGRAGAAGQTASAAAPRGILWGQCYGLNWRPWVDLCDCVSGQLPKRGADY